MHTGAYSTPSGLYIPLIRPLKRRTGVERDEETSIRDKISFCELHALKNTPPGDGGQRVWVCDRKPLGQRARPASDFNSQTLLASVS